MEIGLYDQPNGGSIWHAVVSRDGATYDSTFGRWFEPGTYEELGR